MPVGLTLDGFKQFVSNDFASEDDIRTVFLENLGYDGSTLH